MAGRLLASIKTSIMPTGSPWCVPPSGFDVPVNVPGDAGQRQGFDHGHGFALMCATVRALMPPVNKSGGASQLKTSIMVTGSP